MVLFADIKTCRLIFVAAATIAATYPVSAQTLRCSQVFSSGGFNCTDSGGYPSTCATATCPQGTTLTGGGGACSAGDRRLKTATPASNNRFIVMCEQQGVAPSAVAVCCSVGSRIARPFNPGSVVRPNR